MKIPDKNPGLILEKTLLGKTTPKKTTDAQAQETSHSSPADSVNISEKARHIQHLNALAASGPEVRTERVAALQQKIEAGTYAVDGKQIAEKLIRSAVQDKVS